jgi:hypothetical protein
MCIQLITHKDPLSLRGGCYRLADMRDKVRFFAGRLNGRGHDVSCSQMQVSDENLGSVTNVVKFPSFHFRKGRWQGWPVSFERLNAGFFIDTDGVNPLFLIIGERLLF